MGKVEGKSWRSWERKFNRDKGTFEANVSKGNLRGLKKGGAAREKWGVRSIVREKMGTATTCTAEKKREQNVGQGKGLGGRMVRTGWNLISRKEGVKKRKKEKGTGFSGKDMGHAE